jgi:hypothetical protein
MRLIVTAVLAAASLVPGTARAQQWTAEEQEIIDLNQECWEAWAAKDLSRIAATCNEHADARGWWTADVAPEIGWMVKNAERWIGAVGSKEEWIYFEIRPLSVRLFNGTALIHFWATRTYRDLEGEVQTLSQKHLNIWQRIDGRWTWIGGMATPDPK